MRGILFESLGRMSTLVTASPSKGRQVSGLQRGSRLQTLLRFASEIWSTLRHWSALLRPAEQGYCCAQQHRDLGSRDEVAQQYPRTRKSLLSLPNKHRVDTGWMPQVLCCVVNATPAKPCNIANGRVIREPLTTVILQRSCYSREKCDITLPVGDIIQPRCTRSITQCICRVLSWWH
jgi:hypothetical protein